MSERIKPTDKQLETCQFSKGLHPHQSLGMDISPDLHLQNILSVCKFEISHVLPNARIQTSSLGMKHDTKLASFVQIDMRNRQIWTHV